MRIKRYNNKIYAFEKKTGMTGVFSDKEEEMLLNYARGNKKTDFIKRLYKIGILNETLLREDIIKTIESEESHLKLDSLHIDITDECPLKCLQCYKSPDKKIKEMTFKKFKEFIDEADKLRVFQIAIGGGEPLVHPQIVKFIEYINSTQMSSSITTSGVGLNEKLLDELIKVGLNHIQISLNSIDEDINNKSRDGYFEAVRALKILQGKKISFGINMVIRKDNLNTFIKTIDYAKEMGANNVNILRYKGSKFEDYNKNALSEGEFFKLAKLIKSIKGIKIKVDSAYSKLLIHLNNGNVNSERIGCMALKSFISITPEGNFKPCSHLRAEEKSETIYKYYTKNQNSNFVDNKSYKKESLCFDCRYLNLCEGCMAISEFLYGDANFGEKRCEVYKKESRI